MHIAALVSSAPARAWGFARTWAALGDDVTVVLLDRAAAAARPGHVSQPDVESAIAEGIAVLAHDDALRRRGVSDGNLVPGIKVVDLDDVAGLVIDVDKVVWL